MSGVACVCSFWLIYGFVSQSTFFACATQWHMRETRNWRLETRKDAALSAWRCRPVEVNGLAVTAERLRCGSMEADRSGVGMVGDWLVEAA